MHLSNRTKTIVSLTVSIVAAVLAFFISRRIVASIEENIQAMQGEPDEEETEPLEDRVLDPKEIIETEGTGNNGSDQKEAEKSTIKS